MWTRFFRALGWILVAAILALSVVPPSLRPMTSIPHNLEHFAIFALCGYSFGLGYRSHHLLLAIGLAAFSGLVEMLQLMTPGRHARSIDFIVDALASCVGVLVGRITLERTSSEAASANR